MGVAPSVNVEEPTINEDCREEDVFLLVYHFGVCHCAK